MGGGLMQLVAYGAQDIYLTGNPQITFFKVVYRRHTNFSMEAIEQTINGQATAGSRITSTISRNGDLISRIYHSADLDTSDQPCPVNVGAACFDTIEIEIGGQQIDKITGNWMEVWAELTENNSAAVVRGNDYGNEGIHKRGTLFQLMSCMGGMTNNNASGIQSTSAIIPLPFWFCRNPGLALPLIALQYHEVKLITTLSSGSYFKDDKLQTWVDYIYLDTDERRRFAQVSHEYLIEQLQYFTDSQVNFDLNFNHPVKELIWTHTPDSNNNNLGELKFGGSDIRGVNFKLKLNGHDRFAERNGEYFTRTQIWEHHTGPGGLNASDTVTGDMGQLGDTIAVYSFALKPEEHQPSGTCNFSRIDNAQLIVGANSGNTVTATDTTIYAINYNVLRIMSGMGGLAYSN
jgi:hypothetical protein